jgi:signal transduction histidine kinase
MNIVTNALDALLEQPEQFDKQILIQTQRLTPNQIGVRICDNGPGIQSEIKSKIFDPFFTTKPVGEGTGLGLTICYKIIEKHQGRITVNSQYGEGTEFFITLPVQQKNRPEMLAVPVKTVL